MIQVIEKLANIDLKHPAASWLTVHRLVAEGFQRIVCRSSGPETIRAVQEVLFINRLQQHDNRPLKDFILQGGNSEWASLSA